MPRSEAVRKRNTEACRRYRLRKKGIDAPLQRPPLEERFWAKVDKSDPDGCWEWTGSKDVTGYGRIGFRGKTPLAHRVAWYLEYGEWPKETIDHRVCSNPSCVRVSHMEDVSLRKNILRGENPPAQNARKTHCIRGHPFSGDNLYRHTNGGRECRICKRASNAVYRRKAAKEAASRTPYAGEGETE